MKYILLILINVIITSSINAQSIKRQSVGSYGSVDRIGAITYSQTAGQSFYTGSQSNKTINAGFQQPINYTIEEIQQPKSKLLDISLFPNPAQYQITIKSSNAIKDAFILITDLSGKFIYRSALLSLENHKIDCSQWSTGSYYVNISDHSGAQKTLKLIISK